MNVFFMQLLLSNGKTILFYYAIIINYRLR